MIFALRARPPCTKRRLSLREPKGYSSSSTPKMFNYWFIIPRFRRLSTGKLENFSLFVPFSGAGRRAPLCGAGMRPHFLWVLPKENGRARSKERRFSPNLTPSQVRRRGVLARDCRQEIPGFSVGRETSSQRLVRCSRANWNCKDGCRTAFDQRFFPRSPLRLALPRRTQAARSETERAGQKEQAFR